MRTLSAALFALAALSGFAAAQPSAAGCTGPAFRQFDFWAGAWTVTDSAGKTVYGTNTVTVEEQGCLLHEHWVGSRGGSGQSFNFLAPRTGTWSQVWVGSDGTILRLEGALAGSAMTLKGAGIGAKGEPTIEWIEWTPYPDGRVRQVWRQSTDAGRTCEALRSLS